MRREPGGPARICVTNAKGGTGKTTIAINVAGALDDRGRDVLFVDLDPQGNATEGLGLVDAYRAGEPTLFDVLTDERRRGEIADLIVEHDEMDVVPSNVAMLQAEHELTIADLVARAKHDGPGLDPAALTSLGGSVSPEGISGPHAIDGLDAALSTIEDGYDYVIVDSPPFYGKLTVTGIYAARNILIPALTEATSERAIELLIDQLTALEERTDIETDTLGVVANRVENTNEDETMLRWFNAVFPDDPVWQVRKRVALQRAFSEGQSLFAYPESVDVEAVFEDVAAELDAKFDQPEVTA